MDPEIEAMATISEALDELEPDAVARVLRWATGKYGSKGAAFRSKTTEAANNGDFAEFHELFDAANPQSGPERALVAGYWFQVMQAHSELESQTLNTELKNLGHQSTNITRDLDALINRSPRLVMQVRKTGGSRQARKRYKLTVEGQREVERLLRSGQTEDNVE